MKTFFIYALTNAKYFMKNKINKIDFMMNLYETKQDLYQRIKLLIISIYPSMNKFYNDFEYNNKISKLLYNEIIQYLIIYDINFLSKCFGSKAKTNNIPNNHLEFLKLNFNNYEEIIKYFSYLCLI